MPSTDYSALHVLIVDDFHNFRSALAKNMYTLGFRHINSVSSGAEAIGVCRKHHYDIILSDYNLGQGKNGQQLLEEMRFYGLYKRSDVFMLISADTSRDVVMASYDCEPSDYLTKPITGKTLEQRIKRLMAKREALVDIYEAIDDGDNQKAIAYLELCLQEPSRYNVDCQKLLGELYIKEESYDLAEALYRNVLKARDLDWAQVGLANVALKRGDINDAIDSLEHVVSEHPSYLKAYDSMTQACTALGDNKKLQQILEKAASISPMSIGRQKILADTALANGDVELAMSAYKKTIKYGANSHYDSVDNHLNFARAITKTYDNDIDKAKGMSLDAVVMLNNIDDQYEISEDQKIQAKLLNSQINALQGNKTVSNALLTEAQELIINNPDRNVDTEVEAVNALIAKGDTQEAKNKLSEMVEYYKDDQLALEKIDPLLEEPISENGKKIIGTINKKGIDFYKQKDFEKSISYFTEAQKKYPRYIGLKLNLIQAMVSDIRDHGANTDHEEKCSAIFKVIERYITPHSDKYQRYKQLKLMSRQVIQQAKYNEKHQPRQENIE